MAVSNLIKSYLSALGQMNFSTLKPMSNFIFHPLFAKEWCTHMEAFIDAVEKKNIPIAKLLPAISGSSSFRCQLFFLLQDLKIAKLPVHKRKKISNFFHTLLLNKTTGDPHGWRSNLCHNPTETIAIMQKPFCKANPTIAQKLGRLYSAGYHLANGLYTDFYTDYSAENFGPYPVGPKQSLVIKHFGDLCPKELWSETNAPCKSLTIYVIYENVEFRCDAISCHGQYEGNPITGAIQYLVEVDGKIAEESLLHDLLPQLEKESAIQWQRLICQDHETLKQKGVYQRCYTLKTLFEAAGMDWKPDIEMLAAVKGKPFALDFWKPGENEQEYWHNVTHPEVEVYP